MCAGAIFWGNVRRVVFALQRRGVVASRVAAPRTRSLPCRAATCSRLVTMKLMSAARTRTFTSRRGRYTRNWRITTERRLCPCRATSGAVLAISPGKTHARERRGEFHTQALVLRDGRAGLGRPGARRLDAGAADLDPTIEGIVERYPGLGALHPPGAWTRRRRRTGLSFGEWACSACPPPGPAVPPHAGPAGRLGRPLAASDDESPRPPGAHRPRPPAPRSGGPPRFVQVELTEQGHRAWEESVGMQAAKEELITSAALDGGEREQLNGLLRRLTLASERTGMKPAPKDPLANRRGKVAPPCGSASPRRSSPTSTASRSRPPARSSSSSTGTT